MKQVVWTRIAAVEVYIRQVEKYLKGKTGKYQSKLLSSNVLHLPLKALRTCQTSVRNSFDTASLASNWRVKMWWTFWFPAYYLWFWEKFLKRKSIQVKTSRLHWITCVSAIRGNTCFLHYFSTKMCVLYWYLMHSLKFSIYFLVYSIYSKLLSSLLLAQPSLWSWKFDNISHKVHYRACTV